MESTKKFNSGLGLGVWGGGHRNDLVALPVIFMTAGFLGAATYTGLALGGSMTVSLALASSSLSVLVLSLSAVTSLHSLVATSSGDNQRLPGGVGWGDAIGKTHTK